MSDHNWTNQVVLKDLGQFKQIYLVPLADLHVGSRDAALDVVQGYINWIATHENAFTILNGDLMNCATKESTPELYEDLVTPDMAYAQLVDLLRPIQDRILLVTRGGHEEQIFRKAGHDYMAQLATEFKVPYQPDGGMVGVRLSEGEDTHSLMVWIYATHGWGGARKIGSKVAKIEELAAAVEADVFVLSHDHTQVIHRLNTLTPPGQIRWGRPAYMTVRRRLLVNTGGFVRYEGYIRRKGYLPQDLGTPRIRIEIKRRGNQRELDLHASL